MRVTTKSQKKYTSFVPGVPLAVRDILSAYELSDSLVLTGSLYDLVRHARAVHANGTEHFMETIEKQFGKAMAEDVGLLFSPDTEAILRVCRTQPEIYLLKLAALVCDASEMERLNDAQLAEWRATIDEMTSKKTPVGIPAHLSEITQEMRDYLENAVNYCDTTLALT